MLEQRFLGFINDNHLFTSTDRILLAVSGGLDSMVMAEVFHRTDRAFAIAHVNFSLRGMESDADAIFVQNKAELYRVPLHMTHFDTARVAKERGISIQMAARDLRYEWFSQLLNQHSYAYLATAHHQNDVLETLLLNLVRGTGIAGLHGIAPKQNQIVRPMLFATREELAAYAQTRNIAYREDSSNADDKYARNRIRHHVVPVLSELNPGMWETLPRTVERFRAAETLVRDELERSWQETATPQGERIWLPTEKLLALPELAFRLAEWLKPFGFTSDQAERIRQKLGEEVGQTFLTSTHRIVHERGGLLLEPLINLFQDEIILSEWPKSPVPIADSNELDFSIVFKDDEFTLSPDSYIACLDADRLSFPLIIRPWQVGDRFRPLGMNGTKLVSDLLNDLKVSRSERENTFVLLSGGQIAWVIGRRIAHPFRITGQTTRVAILNCRSK